jgi:hypothetical protein
MIATLKKKLHPDRFTEMSPKMAAIVAYILDEGWTDPKLVEMVVTSDGHILGRHDGDIGLNDFMGAESDLVRNWNNLLDCAGLDEEERTEAERCYANRIRRA